MWYGKVCQAGNFPLLTACRDSALFSPPLAAEASTLAFLSSERCGRVGAAFRFFEAALLGCEPEKEGLVLSVHCGRGLSSCVESS